MLREAVDLNKQISDSHAAPRKLPEPPPQDRLGNCLLASIGTAGDLGLGRPRAAFLHQIASNRHNGRSPFAANRGIEGSHRLDGSKQNITPVACAYIKRDREMLRSSTLQRRRRSMESGALHAAGHALPAEIDNLSPCHP